MQISSNSARGVSSRGIAGGALLLLAAGAVGAQSPGSPRESWQEAPRWTIGAPEATLAWYAVLADLRVPGDGAFAFTRATPGAPTATADRARPIGAMRGHEVLHFVPLYHPSGDRAALAAALRASAEPIATAPSPRAALLVGALVQSLSASDRRAQLPALAAALESRRVVAPAPQRMAVWQRALDSLFLPALSPWLVLERLDRGRLLVVPALGPEGRLFAGTQDRADNLVAVGSFDGDADALAPLHAFVREVCFPAVSRATTGARGFAVGDAESARRASVAAVRCGAALLDARSPAQAEAYRAFWLRQSAGAGANTGSGAGARAATGESTLTAFDRVFPADAALSPALDRAIARVKDAR